MPQFDFFLFSKILNVLAAAFTSLVFILISGMLVKIWVNRSTIILFNVFLLNELKLFKAGISFLTMFACDLVEQFIYAPKLAIIPAAIIAFAAIGAVIFSEYCFKKVVAFVSEVTYDVNDDDRISATKNLIWFIAIFLFIGVTNFFGLIPSSYTFTSSAVAPFFIAISVFFTWMGLVLRNFGFKSFAGLLPAGTSIFIAPLIVFIELISNIAKFISLGVRLFANMFAGHLLLKVFYCIVFQFFVSVNIIFLPFNALASVFTIFIILLELLIAFLQAFVMLLLVVLYFKETRLFALGSH
jgi:ATP synthase subunit 6